MDELNIKPLGSENPNPQVPNVTPETQAVPNVPSTPAAPTAFSLDSIGSVNQQQTTAPSVETAQPSTTEKIQLPTSETSLSGAAMTPAGTPDATVPKKSSLLKTGLIVAGVVVVVGATAAAIFWGKGWPFKGDIIAVNEATRFAALQLCPDDQYQPKQSDTTLQLLKGSLVQANAQSLIPTTGLKTINTRTTLAPVTNVTATNVNQDAVMATSELTNSVSNATAALADTTNSMVNVNQATKADTTNTITTNTARTNTSNAANELSVSAVQSTLQQAASANELSVSATESTLKPATSGNTAANESTGIMVPPERTGGLTINPNATQQTSCQDIPHDNLVPGDRQCKMIDVLYADPTGYLINDLTKSHLDEWYKICHPTPVEVQCRTNEELSKETNECVCKAGYFDISAEIPASTATKTDTAILSLANTDSVNRLANTESVNTATLSDTSATRLSTNNTAVNTDSISSLRLNTNTTAGGKCVNCDDIAKYIERYETELASATDEATKASLQERLDLLNKIAEKHGCKKTQVKCVDGQVLTSDGTCECPANTNFNESTQKCEFDCNRLVKSIVSIRESATKTPETQNQLEELLKQAEKNQCDVPVEKTTCQMYQDDAQKALSEKKYDAYINASMKLLSADCGREVNSCERTLAEASLVKRVQEQVVGNADLEEKYKNRLEELKAEYYANPECRDDNRCSEIDGTKPTTEVVGAAPTRIANTDSILKLATADLAPTSDATPTTAAAPTTASPVNLDASALRLSNVSALDRTNSLKLTPGSIFEDDKEYYEKNCKKPDLTCDDLLKRYNLSSTTPSANIALLDVSDEVRQQIERCMPTQRLVPQNPKISCEPSSRNVTTGNEVTWTASVEGASNPDNVTYAWSGDASGTGASVKSTYNTAGEKTVVVSARGAGEQTISATCTTNVSPISPVQPPTNPPALDPASNPPSPSPSPSPTPTPTPSPSPAVAPAIAPPTPPSPVSSPTPPPSSASAPIVKVPTPTAPAVAPATPPSPISSPTPAPSTPVSLPITTPSAPVVATTSTPTVVSPAAPSAPTIHASAPVTVVTPAAPTKETPPTITPTGPEVYIYLIGFVVGQLYFFRRKVFGLVRNK